MKPTQPTTDYFHKVVDCQWACPAYTPVPQYIGLIAESRFTDAYLLNWRANVFPGILGRTCDRPCEPACRRGRVDKEPVAICRLKRVAADNKLDVSELLPIPAKRNGKRIALVGGGPASLTVARDLNLAGYDCTVFDREPKAGGMVRTRVPHFRVPEEIVDEETSYILDNGVTFQTRAITSMKALLAESWDAVFVGTGAPRGLDLILPGRNEAAANVHIATDWLANIWFKHTKTIGRRVVVIGAGNTAMDCARSARRIGGQDVTVVARGTLDQMRAAPWEREEAKREGVTIRDLLVPKAYLNNNGRLSGVEFESVHAEEVNGKRKLVPSGKPPVIIECDDVIVAVGQESLLPWIERDIGVQFDSRSRPVFDPRTLASTHPKIFFGGDVAFGPKNIVTAVGHGREAAISIDLFLRGADLNTRPSPKISWSPGEIRNLEIPPRNPELSRETRHTVPRRSTAIALETLEAEAELGFDLESAIAEAKRCLHCETQTIYETPLCVDCKACEQVCPTNCIAFTKNGEEADLRTRLSARNLDQALLIGGQISTGRIMVKTEDLCLHCGLCAENCPTGAWHMEDFFLDSARATDLTDSPIPAREIDHA